MLLKRQYYRRACLRGVEANSDKAPLRATACSSTTSRCSGTCCSQPPPPLSSFDADATVCSQLCVCLCVNKPLSPRTLRLLSYSHTSRREICARGGQCGTSEGILYHGYNLSLSLSLSLYVYIYTYIHAYLYIYRTRSLSPCLARFPYLPRSLACFFSIN